MLPSLSSYYMIQHAELIVDNALSHPATICDIEQQQIPALRQIKSVRDLKNNNNKKKKNNKRSSSGRRNHHDSSSSSSKYILPDLNRWNTTTTTNISISSSDHKQHRPRRTPRRAASSDELFVSSGRVESTMFAGTTRPTSRRMARRAAICGELFGIKEEDIIILEETSDHSDEDSLNESNTSFLAEDRWMAVRCSSSKLHDSLTSFTSAINNNNSSSSNDEDDSDDDEYDEIDYDVLIDARLLDAVPHKPVRRISIQKQQPDNINNKNMMLKKPIRRSSFQTTSSPIKRNSPNNNSKKQQQKINYHKNDKNNNLTLPDPELFSNDNTTRPTTITSMSA